MSIKKVISVSAVVIGAFLLSSCYRMAVQPTGSISLRFAGPAARAISASAKVRVYLYTYDSSKGYGLYTFGNGSPYKEFTYGGGTDSLSGVPTGLWDVLVSIGTDGPGNSFYVTRYGDSGVIDVVGGNDTSASVSTKASPFAYSTQLAGTSLNSVEFDYYNPYNLFASTPKASYAFAINPQYASPPSLSSVVPTPVSLPSGLQINSMEPGYLGLSSTGVLTSAIVPFYNSNNGIETQVSGSYQSITAPSSSGTQYSALSSTTVRPAAAASTSYGAIEIYYTRNGAIEGSYVNGTTYTAPNNGTNGGAPWITITPPSPVTGNPVYEMAPDLNDPPLNLSGSPSPPANHGFVYFATKFGAFRASPSLINSSNSTAGQLVSGNVLKFTAPNSATIQAVAVDDFDNIIYIGTPYGAYYATLDESSSTSVISGGWKLIPATKGESILGIQVDDFTAAVNSPPVAVALRSRYNLYTITKPPTQGGTVSTYPFYAGLSGTINSMTFVNGTLYAGGSEGLESVVVDPAQPSLP